MGEGKDSYYHVCHVYMILACRNDREVSLERDEFGLRFGADGRSVLVATEVTLFEFDDE